MKSEPDEFSIDDLVRAPRQTTSWFGVRNYQARNFMRDMKLGELALFYHSSCPEPGIAASSRSRRSRIPMRASSTRRATTTIPSRPAKSRAGGTWT